VANLLVRPFPVALLATAGQAIRAAAAGDVEPLHALYVVARDALEDLDPDEVHDPVIAHPEAGHRDRPALFAALDVAEAWEGVVAVGASIGPTPRFRGFILTCAWCRYLDGTAGDLEQFKAWCRGEPLPGLSDDDTALYAALPALLGLGPELPDELPGPCPAEGEPAWRLLGLPEADWDGVDPLDGVAISPAECAARYPGVSGPWKPILARGAESGGLLVRSE
jgi:hypothetical protein